MSESTGPYNFLGLPVKLSGRASLTIYGSLEEQEPRVFFSRKTLDGLQAAGDDRHADMVPIGLLYGVSQRIYDADYYVVTQHQVVAVAKDAVVASEVMRGIWDDLSRAATAEAEPLWVVDGAACLGMFVVDSSGDADAGQVAAYESAEAIAREVPLLVLVHQASSDIEVLPRSPDGYRALSGCCVLD